MARRSLFTRSCVYTADCECGTNIDYETDRRVGCYIMHLKALDVDVRGKFGPSYDCTFDEEITFSGPDAMKNFVEKFLERIPQNAFLWYYTARYDTSFIISYLMENCGYTSDDWDATCRTREAKNKARHEWIQKHPEYRGQAVFSNDDLLTVIPAAEIPKAITDPFKPKCQIHPILSGSNVIAIEIWNSAGHKLTIADVANKFTNLPDWDAKNNCPITGVQAIARMFGGSKSGLDVLKYRGLDYVPGEEEITRCELDTKWIKLAMEKMYDLGLTGLTLAQDAWSIFTAISDLTKGIDSQTKRPLGDKAWENRIYRLLQCGFTEEEIEKFIGTVDDDGILYDLPEEWQFRDGYILDIRDSYMGGVTMVNPKYQNIELRVGGARYTGDHWARVKWNIAHDDCNSMHPASMKCPMPYGAPWMTNTPEGEFYIMAARCKFKLKKNAFCTVSNKGRRDMSLWLSEGEQELTMTNYDWEWFKRNYDYEIIGNIHCLNWHTRVNKALCIYVDHFTEMKKKWKAIRAAAEPDSNEYIEADIMYYIAKILMNSLYGKWGQDPRKPYINCVYEGSLSYHKSSVQKGEYDDPWYHKYLPMACAITGCSRDRLWTHINKIG